jgi:hypothetical protein
MGTTIRPPEPPPPATSIPLTRLQVPLNLAVGLYELLTDEELIDHYADIRAECKRRDWNLDDI